eukprot:4988500-Prymnesium_polylepis.1
MHRHPARHQYDYSAKDATGRFSHKRTGQTVACRAVERLRGCACSMGNHKAQFRSGSLHASKTKIAAAGGTMNLDQKGDLQGPMETDNMGIQLWKEPMSICNKHCNYVLLARSAPSR